MAGKSYYKHGKEYGTFASSLQIRHKSIIIDVAEPKPVDEAVTAAVSAKEEDEEEPPSLIASLGYQCHPSSIVLIAGLQSLSHSQCCHILTYKVALAKI